MPSSKVHPLRLLASVVLLCIGLVGCAGKDKRRKRSVAPGPIVRTVEIDGNQALEDKDIVEHLNLRPTPVIHFGGANYYVPGLEEIDRGRLEELYAAHGRFDARVTDVDVEVETKGDPERWARRKERRERAGRRPPKPLQRLAHVRFEVEEGEPTKITSVAFESRRPFPLADATPSKGKLRRRNIPQPLTQDVLVEGALPEQGDTLDAERLQSGATTMEQRLRERGFAFATVEASAEVDRAAHTAKVRYIVDPKQAVVIDSVELQGNVRVPEDLVANEWAVAIGKPYSPGLLESVESAVYGMGVFSAVTVSIELLEGDDTRVKAVVRVRESKLQRIKFGGRLGVDPIRWEQVATFNYRHESLFGRLTRLNLKLEAGYAELPNFWNARQHGPVALVEVKLRKKGWLERQLVWTEAPSFELGIWDGYQFYSVRNRIGVERFFSRYFELGLSYNNRFTDFFNITEDFEGEDSLLGLDFRDPFFVSFLELEAIVHLVDKIVEPQNGVRLRTSYDFANRYLGSQFNFHMVAVALTGYWRAHDRVRLLARARTGFLFPYGGSDVRGVPIDMRFYLGGGYTVRGWPLRQLSPRLSSNPNIPIGGYTEVLANLEAQFRVWDKLWLAVFGDGGDVRRGVAEIVPAGWQATLGGGLRYGTPVGTIRLDFGYRLTRDDARFPVEPVLFEGDNNFAIHLAIGEAF